jgi:hypothetical protein
MKQITDDAMWLMAYLDTPFGIPKDRVRRAHELRDPEHLADVPGVNLKTRELASDGFPAAFAKLVRHDATGNRVVVRSKPDCLNDNLRCVWIGTTAEYACMWRVD